MGGGVIKSKRQGAGRKRGDVIFHLDKHFKSDRATLHDFPDTYWLFISEFIVFRTSAPDLNKRAN